ncbi:MAG: lysylphosphatidylglycerol synthase transmembrane domain-containing protein [bacterium]|nr:lysylphosphatidylglycerol synthase transmembrane domain-containing protein [bacterium]
MKRILGLLVKVGISLGLVWWFLQQVAWDEVETAVLSADWRWVLLSVGLFLLSNLLGALQWGMLLKAQNIRLSLPQVILLYFVGVFFNNFMVGNIGGDAIRVYDLKRMTGRGTAGFAATFLDRLIGLFTLSCFSVVAFAGSPGLWDSVLWMPIGCLGLGLFGILCFGFSRRLSSAILSLASRALPVGVVGVLKDIREGFVLYRKEYGLLFRVGCVALCVQLCRMGVYYASGEALGLSVVFRHFLVFIPLIAIVAAVPISFGGIGVRENLGVLMFGRVGVAPAGALTMMFLGYLAGIVASLAGGIAFVLRRSKSQDSDSG